MSSPRTEDRGEMYHLNGALADWAFRLTEHVDLGDTPEMQKDRAAYASANARRPPFVLKGDSISSSTFFSACKMSEWANQWVKYHTGGKGNYVTTGDGGHRHALVHCRCWPRRAAWIGIASWCCEPQAISINPRRA